jgi:hypothetical protein
VAGVGAGAGFFGGDFFGGDFFAGAFAGAAGVVVGAGFVGFVGAAGIICSLQGLVV